MALACLLPCAVSAQTPGACALGQASATLNVSNVRATLFNGGNLFYARGTQHAYYVPASSPKTAAYAANFWVGGRVDGEVRVAGATYGYSSGGLDAWEFWPGPLNPDATLLNAADCSAYDRIWVVSAADVARLAAGGAPTADLAGWPVGLGAPAVDAAGRPIETTDRGRRLNLAAGERPVVYGSQTAFWVMNDVGNVHRTTGSKPLGVEVQVAAFAIASGQKALDQATFYRYRVVNRNRHPIDDVRLSWWTDSDLGQVNEWQGVDLARNMALTYNPSEDRVYSPPPATGVDFLDQPLGAYMYSRNGDSRRDGPRTAIEYDRIQRGLWRDGSPVVTYLTGRVEDLPSPAPPSPDGGPPPGPELSVDVDTTVFALPGDPVTRSFWSDINADGRGAQNSTGNKRSIPSTRPQTLAPGASVDLTVAFLFAQGGDHLDSITELRKASNLVQSLFDAGLLLQTSAVSPAPTARADLRTPADRADEGQGLVTFSWTEVPGALVYRVEVSTREGFEAPTAFRTYGTTLTTGDLPTNQLAPLYWRVVPVTLGGDGPPSEARRFFAYRYTPGPLALSDRTPAFVEIQGPGGVNPCGPAAVSTTGCDEVGGNGVLGSPNGTGQYALRSGSIDPSVLGEREVEIRWGTEGTGSYAIVGLRVGRVPFSVWDIGVTPPGQPNDPLDDVRLIPIVGLVSSSGVDPSAQGCRFEFDGDGAARQTLPIAAAYPTDPEALRALERKTPFVSPNGCVAVNSLFTQELRSLPGSRPVYNVVIGSEVGEALHVRDLRGTVLRFYTADATPTRLDLSPAGPQVAVLRSPYPNPTTGRVTIELTLERAGPAHLAVVDVLGREVAVLASGEDQAAGWRRYTVDTAGWAPGLYSVFLRTEQGGQSSRFTVVR